MRQECLDCSVPYCSKCGSTAAMYVPLADTYLCNPCSEPFKPKSPSADELNYLLKLAKENQYGA